MADSFETQMRLVEGRDTLPGNECNQCLWNYHRRGKNPKIISILIRGNKDNVAYSEIDAPTAVFDENTVPKTISVKSASVNDTLLGTHCRKVIVIGIDENDELNSEEIDMDGTTQSDGTILWKRAFHGYGSDFGATKTAAGAIIFIDTATGLTTYLTIAIGKQESNGAAFFVPAGKRGKRLYSTGAHMTFANIANATSIYLQGNEGPGQDPQVATTCPVLLTCYAAHVMKLCNHYVIGLSGLEVKLTPMAKHITASETFFWHMDYVIADK